MIEGTFTYEVEVDDENCSLCEVTFKMELTEEQAKRLQKSYETNKYIYIDEDENIKDIYEMVHDEATAIEESEHEDVDYDLLNFKYPAELTNVPRK